MEYTDLVTLTRFMADSGYSADEVAYAVEKPWKHEDTLAEARAAEYAERNAMDDVVSGNVWPEQSTADAGNLGHYGYLPHCDHCHLIGHSTEAHDSALSERIVNETVQYNRDVFGAR